MKSFKSLLGLLVLILLVPTYPVFGADNPDEQEVEHSQQGGLSQRFFGPGSLLRGVGEYCRMLPRRPGAEKWDIVRLLLGVTFGCLTLKWTYSRLSKGKDSSVFDLPFIIFSYNLLRDSLPSIYSNISIIRNIQKVRDLQSVEDEVIKGYITRFLEVPWHQDALELEDLIVQFFQEYRDYSLGQLQDCVEQVLVENGWYEKNVDGSGLKRIEEYSIIRVMRLRTILEGVGVNMAPHLWGNHLNNLLGYPDLAVVRNIKRAQGEEEDE